MWGLWDQNIALNQIKSDWHLLAWAAKWLHDPPHLIKYQDQRFAKNIGDDKKLLEGIWKLLDAADIVITQNGKSFDEKKLNARFIIQGFKPPSPFKHLDTRQIANKKFGFTSSKLEYMADKICKKFKKLKHKQFPGHELWTECLKGNLKAWKEMERYNKHDVLATEELYKSFQPWDQSINFNVYTDDLTIRCNCGNSDLAKNGFVFTHAGKFQRYNCKDCGAKIKGRVNLLSRQKRAALQKE